MDKQPKISIIVPIYNVSKSIDRCLQSLLSQTLKDIEIILVDDGSTDDSAKIIQFYAKKDTRIKPVLLQENKGTLVARKKGVLYAKGQYILFCDSDDQLFSGAAQIAWNEMLKNPVDILQFATTVVYDNEYTADIKNNLSNMLKPYPKMIYGDLCEACFHRKQFGYTLWNKMYSAELCQKAFALIKDEYAIVSEDLYTFFVISYFAKTYRGIQDRLYIYNFGSGITGNQYLGYKEFEKQCNAVEIVPLLETFLKEQCAENKYYTFYHEIRNNIIANLIYQWRNQLSVSVSVQGYELLRKKLGIGVLVSELAKKYGDDQFEIVKRLSRNNERFRKGKRVKRIGVYYHRMRNGGAEKIIAELIVKWTNWGYQITLFTDEEPSEEDYYIPETIERIVLPSFLISLGGKYKKRARLWENMIKKHGIDTIIYNSPMSHILLWDTCLLKGLGCNFVIETHCMFAGAMWYSPMYSCFLPLIYRMVDCVVSLSRVDIAFWKNYCPAYYIQNPIEVVPYNEMSKLDSKNVLWVGRIAEEKQPEAILEAFKLVVEKIPEATLTMVGSGDSGSWLDRLMTKAKELNIYNKVEFAGFQLDVSSFYKKSSVFAFTSMCEAAPVVLSESKSYGLPIVMFDLPNVEFARDSRGIINIPQMDVWALANEIIGLLENEQKRKAIGDAGRESIEEFAQFDIEKAWKTLFCNIEKGIEYVVDENNSIMLDQLFQNMLRGLNLVSRSTALNHDSFECAHYEEVLNRHEEVVNRHEEVVNRHETSINHQWEIQKWHEERISVLENRLQLWKRVVRKICLLLKTSAKN